MIYRIRHVTELTYARPLSYARYNLRLRPVVWPGQRMLDYRLATDPVASASTQLPAPWPVHTDRLTFTCALTTLEITSSFTAAVEAVAEPTREIGLAALREAALAARALGPRAPAAYLFASPLVPLEAKIGEWAAPFLAGGGVVEGARALATAIYRHFAYEPGATSSRTPPIAAFRARRGVCQDFAQVMIAALRYHGIPAAYVSGYLRTEPPPGRERLVGADAMHAWVSLWAGPDLGWLGIDPTNDCWTSDSHIAIAMGRDYGDVSPIDGIFLGSAWQGMKLAVDVVPVNEAASEEVA